MMRNEDIPVVRRIPTDRNDVFAFAIEGHLDDSSLENLYGLLDAAYEQYDEIDLLIRLTGYEGVDWTAAFSESMLSMRSKSLKHLRRYAIVGGPLWIQASITLMQPFLSIEMRSFEADEEQDAWEWLSAKPIES
ncbi:STAS/SEC14 domain-containing protein [Brucellaceae bacterium VT-16-1752]|uniref:STAS/SEC14 domain-containing protein n=4 Tax=Ochrobactrum TaxID=528 RepID=A0ABY2Y727_9HYPH|nr:STAS/SEC14 domain-containing protein [[Ochrobactrum] soli]RRD22123.1 STAS/SEC14 domain-containing protein [Brucellaceae bacterium VT-16-1752]TNV17526.1 STAS/SEC14 domain-containing protein [[Ochrobactrum] teleogrylli]